MRLHDWRSEKGLTAAECGRRLCMTDANPSKAFQRVEQGERIADADMVERIGAMTEGCVTAADMHATRLAWLKANRPERFATPAQPEAAE